MTLSEALELGVVVAELIAALAGIPGNRRWGFTLRHGLRRR